MASSSVTSEITKNGVGHMTKEERKVYDRQIRLWGYEAQNKYVLLNFLQVGYIIK